MTDHLPDSRQFRTALGSFATGVTIVTTRAADGQPIGLTANSFNSLSLDPPMVLWALAKSSKSLPAFAAAEHFAVHILAADQQDLANRFATRGADKFGGVPTTPGERTGAPLVDGACVHIECKMHERRPAGDHAVLIGEVVGGAHGEHAPLLYHSRAFGKFAGF